MKHKKILIYIFIFFLFSNNLYSQYKNKLPSVSFIDTTQSSMSLDFKLISNLIIIQLQINDSKPLNFILDCGLRQTILTKLPFNDSIPFKPARKTTIKGLGSETDLTVWHTFDNKFQINDIVCRNQHLFVLDDDRFEMSKQMGIEINGIIGSIIFENFIVRIDYINEKIFFYEPKKYKYKREHKKRWINIPINVYKNKPYISVPITIQGDSTIMAKILIDSGASDALWLFPGTNDSIIYKKTGTELFLGQGLNGDIYGKQSTISSIQIGKYQLNEVTVSLPDTSAISNSISTDYPGRNGSVGAEILRRFDIIIDYSNKKLLLKRNRNFSDKFNFNLSGIEVEMPFLGLPIYNISQIRKNSPADNAGLKKGDQIISLNNMSMVNYSLNDIIKIFRSKEGRKINMKVKRNEEEIKVKFRLKKME